MEKGIRGMEALKIVGLTKHFGGVYSLQNVSFNVEAGERLAIIGPNGAGKTTLFNLLAGQLSATHGRIFFFGREITSLTPYRRAHLGLARSFQISNLFFNLTVLDNTLLAIQGTRSQSFKMLRPITAYKDLYEKARQLLNSTSLWEKGDALVRNISHGEHRNLEIVLSLALEPRLLLLDEPTAGLTEAESTNIFDIMRTLGSDTTVLFVAHDIDLVLSVANRIIVLHYGEVIADGTPEEIQADSKVKEIYMGIEE
jgi:branched-chain amino acid transport system ATP-binding protein